MIDYSLLFPEDFGDYEWEIAAKGHFNCAILEFDGKRYRLNFFDCARLNQEANDEIASKGLFFEHNLIVVESVSEASMREAVRKFLDTQGVSYLIPEPR